MRFWTGFSAIIFFILLGVIYIATHYARENFSYRIQNVPQNALHWVDPKTENQPLLTAKAAHKFATHYLADYFLPWLTHNPDNFLWVKADMHETIHDYTRYPGYGINHLPNTQQWIENIARNMEMSHFPNAHIKAISVTNTNIRHLPTHQPSFGNFDEAGQGYPFDNLETTFLPANTPALIIQKTRDGAWSFVVTPYANGWVPTPTLATVNNQFIHRWKTGHYVALIKDKIFIVDHRGIMRFTAGIGKIFPRMHYHILIAVANANQRAVIEWGQLKHDAFVQWPMLATPHNIATLMNAMLGVKYGWGGIDNDSDCSLTTMNLFSTFGIGLPRNSSLQADAGRMIDLRRLFNAEKTKLIKSKGVPFFTLLHMPGHVVVYLGEKEGRVYIFQTVWGVHTWTLFGPKGRAIIGTTAITPANLGSREINVKKTWLDEMDTMVLL